MAESKNSQKLENEENKWLQAFSTDLKKCSTPFEKILVILVYIFNFILGDPCALYKVYISQADLSSRERIFVLANPPKNPTQSMSSSLKAVQLMPQA